MRDNKEFIQNFGGETSAWKTELMKG